MAAQQTNQCVYGKGHCLRRNTGPYCTALSLYVMSSVKWAAGEDWGILCLSFCVCVVLNFTKPKDFFFFNAEQNIHRQGTQSSEEALCIQVQPCLFVFSVRRASALVSTVIRLFLLVLLLLCSEQVWGLRSWQEVLRDCLSPEVKGGFPCDGAVMSGWFVWVRMEKPTSPESAIRPHGLHCWAQINNAENSALTQKVLSGCIRGRELARAFTWNDVRTESALLYCPHCVHLTTAALYEPKDKSLEATHRMCYSSICIRGGFTSWNYCILKQQCRQQWRSVSVCVCEREWVMNHKAARALHSFSLKTITCCPCRWQQQWCTPRFSFDVCGQGRVVVMRPDILKQSRWYMYVVVASLFCPVKICADVLCEWHNVCYIIMTTVYITTSSGL